MTGLKLLEDLFVFGGNGSVRFRQLRKTNTKRDRKRDTQRGRVYKADEATKPFDTADVSTVQAMERYVKRVWASKRMHEAFPKMGSHLPRVENGQGRRRAGGNAQMITMPRWARREGIVLHELAHTITGRVYGYHAVAGHGWQYCEIYLKLVLYMMGREAHDALKAAFKQHRVRFTAPRKAAPMSEERRAELVARLAKAWAAKKPNVLEVWRQLVPDPMAREEVGQ